MPRDTWAKANARAKYGPASPKRSPGEKRSARQKSKSSRGKNRKSSRARGRQARAKYLKKIQVLSDRLQTVRCRLWFGKHKGLTVLQVSQFDPSYLSWLSSLTVDQKTDARMAFLISFLRSEISNILDGNGRRPRSPAGLRTGRSGISRSEKRGGRENRKSRAYTSARSSPLDSQVRGECEAMDRSYGQMFAPSVDTNPFAFDSTPLEVLMRDSQ